MRWGGLRGSTVWTILRHEYVIRVRSKSFVLMTVLVPALMAGSILLPMLLQTSAAPSQRRIALADGTGVLADSIRAALDETLPDGRRRFVIEEVPADSAGVRQAQNFVREGVFHAVVVIPDTIFFGGSVVYAVSGTPNIGEMRRIESAVSRQVVALRLWREGLDPKRIRALVRPVRMEAISFGPSGEQSSGEAALVGTIVMAMLMYMSLVLYGGWTMQGVLRDKTSRVVELLISTTSPTELMVGKIVGIGAVGLTQIGIWLGALAAAGIAAPASAVGRYLGILTGISMGAFILYYVTGFLLYATLYAGIGAVSSSPEDAQQLVWPIVLLLLVPIMLSGPAASDPGRPLIVALSFVPYFSPVLMLLRLSARHAGLAALVGSILLNLATIFLTAWLVGRAFRVGILLTGKRPTPREIWRWLREK